MSMLRSVIRIAHPIGPSRANHRFPLDGAETKSEDYQRDVRGRAAQTLTSPGFLAASGQVSDLESVAG
jgi:hypothetical protein